MSPGYKNNLLAFGMDRGREEKRELGKANIRRALVNTPAPVLSALNVFSPLTTKWGSLLL